VKTSTTASRQPFRTASSPSHRFPAPRTLTRRAVTAARASSSHPARAFRTPSGTNGGYNNPSARQTQRAEISSTAKANRESIPRRFTARRGQQATATRAVRASGAFALVSLHFRYVRVFLLFASLGELSENWARVKLALFGVGQQAAAAAALRGVEYKVIWREEHALRQKKKTHTNRLGHSRAAK
jgi:hypothetical protein